MRGDPLARNIAEAIDDLYHENAPPRDRRRMLQLIQHQIERVQYVSIKPLKAELAYMREELVKAKLRSPADEPF